MSQEAVDFLYKHGDLTYSAATDAVKLLSGNGFSIVRSEKVRVLEAVLDSVQRENDRYTAALEKIMGDPMEADAWFRREARKALAGNYSNASQPK